MIIADTSGLLAAFIRNEPTHEDTVAALAERDDEAIVVSPYVLAELDYLLATRVGAEAELRVGRELAGGAFLLPAFDAGALAAAYDIVERYRDQAIGLTDASLVVLADRFETDRVLTLDRRHFDVLRTTDGRAFTVLP